MNVIHPNPVSPTRLSPTRHRRLDHSLVGQLNQEWARLLAESTATTSLRRWATSQPALRGYPSMAALEDGIATADAATADTVLLALLQLVQDGDRLAGRAVLQFMLGKAVRIAASHAGRAERDLLEQLAVTALWDTIATYPIERRPRKVAANLAMDTVHKVVVELAHTTREAPADPTVLAQAGSTPAHDAPADLELLEVLSWGVSLGALTRDDAVLILDVYSPGPGRAGGAAAAHDRGLSWPAARQRCSRAIRRLTAAIQADTPVAGVTASHLH